MKGAFRCRNTHASGRADTVNTENSTDRQTASRLLAGRSAGLHRVYWSTAVTQRKAKPRTVALVMAAKCQSTLAGS